MSYNIRKNVNTYYVRYKNGIAYLYSGNTITPNFCVPISYLTSWEDPAITCDTSKILSGYAIEKTYWQPPNVKSVPAKNLDNTDLSAFRQLICDTTPTVNLSTKIRISIDDSEFGGIYTFDLIGGVWVLNENETITSLTKYPDTTSPHYNTYLIKLVDSYYSNNPYQGYIEYSHDSFGLDNTMKIHEDAYAFPSRFTFIAIKHPDDVKDQLYLSSDQNDLPQASGSRLVAGIKIPLEFRPSYNDFIISSKIGYTFTGPSNNYVLSYAPQALEYYDGNINISGITNNPYYLYDTSTPKTPVCTGINDGGFAYKVSASGFGFDSSMVYADLDNYLSANSSFEKVEYISNNNTYIYDPTVITSGTKIDTSVFWSFAHSCDPYIEPCSNTQFSVITKNNPDLISKECAGSSINIDYACTTNIAKPTSADFSSISTITPIYSGISGLLPVLKHPDVETSGYLYSMSSNETITFSSGNYSGDPNPDNFREWVNKNLQFITYDNGAITSTANNVDIYWIVDTADNTNIYARLFPDYSIINKDYGLLINDAELQFNGNYYWDNTTNYWVSSIDNSVQLRCNNNTWQLGVVDNGIFNTQYELVSVSNDSTDFAPIPNLLSTNAANNIDSRIFGKLPSDAGSPQNIFASIDNNSLTYTRNTNCWASDLDLTSMCVYNSGVFTNNDGVLISPRHAIFTRHSDHYPKVGDKLVFVDSNNQPHIAEVLAQTGLPNYSPTANNDITIVYLDTDMESNGISVSKILPSNASDYFSSWIFNSSADIAGRTIPFQLPVLYKESQNKACIADLSVLTKIFFIGTSTTDGSTFVITTPQNLTRLAFFDPIVGGDSGSPVFLIINNTLVFLGVIYNTNISGSAVIYGSDSNTSSYVESAMNTLASNNGDNTTYTLRTIDLNEAQQSIISNIKNNGGASSSYAGNSTYTTTTFTCSTIPLGIWSNDGHAGANTLITSRLGYVSS